MEDDILHFFGVDVLILLDIIIYGEVNGLGQMYMIMDVDMICVGDCGLVELIIGGSECFFQFGFDMIYSE